MLINGNEIDVTTVMQKNVPEYVPSKELYDRLTEEAKDLLRKYFSNTFSEGRGLPAIFSRVFSKKAWLIRAMENHPGYNGNLQIVLKDQNIARRVDKKAIRKFVSYFNNWCEKFGYYPYMGKKLTFDELEKVKDDLWDRRYKFNYKFPDPITARIYWVNICEDLHRALSAQWHLDSQYDFAIRMMDKIRLELECGTTIVTEENLEGFNKIINDFKIERFRISAGMKLSRLVGKIAKVIGIDKHTDIQDVSFSDQNGELHERIKDMGWNYQFAMFSDAVNPLIIKGTAVISVNPIDFWTMSFGANWASCHTIDKENLRRILSNHYSGCYCGGTESYMLDDSSVVFYFLPEDFNGNNPELEPKVKRCMFYLGEDKLIQSRVYPDGRDGGDASVAPDIRAIMQKLVSELFNVPNLWKLERGTGVCCDVTDSIGPHYRDYECYEDCNVSFLRRIDGYINRKVVRIGSAIICPECGEEHWSEDNIFCDDCLNGYLECCQCGDRVDRDEAIYINGDAYCNDCVEWCYHCDAPVVCGENGEWLEGYGRSVCNRCIDRRYVWAEGDSEYVYEDDAVLTMEGNYWHEDSEGYFECHECEELHDIDEAVEIDGELYCHNCAEHISNN